ncbi:MAG: hypothetical protein A2Z26_00290 [Deltaproteobacteria bacterium RBG_16_66_15]|nr:MAG: hypothetical protein A2X90_00745 [Deltaproteobacteria bacterium GWA2_65_63]OGP36536.1 MAG: hypothetical protein A2X98_07835 [Deltaproteobacteria bacterium GWC2_66_88]OGP78981.1 MAG: hypothetical protein A2Z26_00290 [Deltaproteobacteria bacterium RBG_16_66_15]HAM34219.1 hypothetical protein [Deltaproteobacteria bacterium]
MSTKRFFGWVAVLSILALPMYASAEMKGHGGMSGAGGEHGGMKMEGHGQSGGHDMMKMGDKAFSGKIGPWQGTARIVDMKAHLEASGMKAQGAMPNSHHIAFRLTDAAKKPVTEGKGTVTVTGPDKKETRAEFMVMQGHFGADVNLPTPGKYTFKTEIESGGQKGGATFSYTLK